MSILIHKIAGTSLGNRKFHHQESDAYASDRNLFIADGCLANAIFVLTSGAILSGYAYYLGASDQAISFIVMLPTLLNLVQVFSSVLLEGKKRKKGILVACLLIHRILLGGMFFLPFLPVSGNIKVLLLAVFYGVSYFFGGFTGAACGNWLLKLVPESKVGSYLGLKDSLSLAALTVTSLVAGRMLDFYKDKNAEIASFFILGIVLILLALWDFICLVRIEEPEEEEKEQKYSIRETLWMPLKDAKFKKVLLYYGYWNIAFNIASPFFSIYMVGHLKLDYFYIMLVSLLGSAARVAAAVFWGKMADKISWMWVCKSSIFVLAFSILLWAVTGQENYSWLLPIIQILSGIAWGGIAIANFNIQYAYAPSDKKILYVSTNTAVTSVIGFLATMAGVWLVSVIPDMVLGGINITGVQVVFLISAALLIGCIQFMRKNFE